MVFIEITKKDIIFILIIICLAIGWLTAVITQQTSVSHVKKLYNHLVNQCNEIIEVQDKNNFCITLPTGEDTCGQNDLNILIQSLG